MLKWRPPATAASAARRCAETAGATSAAWSTARTAWPRWRPPPPRRPPGGPPPAAPRARRAAAPAAAAPGAPSPGVALALGFIPGVGAIYNGEFAKALLYIIIFGGLISLMDSSASRGAEPLFGMLLAAFYIYMPIEAYQTAKRRAAGEGAPAARRGVVGRGRRRGSPPP